jgi:hypothetical protein
MCGKWVSRPKTGPGRRLALLLLLLAFGPAVWPTSAVTQEVQQVPAPGDALYEVSLVDGSTLFARITAVDGDRIVLTTVGGTRVEVTRGQIREIQPADGSVVQGEFWVADPNVSRLFFTSTGRSLRQGEGYVGTYLIVLPFVAVGVTDRFTLAAGAPVLTGELEPFYLAPKLQLVRASSAAVSVGTLVFFFNDENVGIAYGVGTFGNRDRAFTAGLGWGYSGTDFTREPLALLGGETRVSRRVKLITENYVLPEAVGVIFSGGLRFIGTRFATDVAVAGIATGDDAGCCVPLVNFSYTFGRRR